METETREYVLWFIESSYRYVKETWRIFFDWIPASMYRAEREMTWSRETGRVTGDVETEGDVE